MSIAISYAYCQAKLTLNLAIYALAPEPQILDISRVFEARLDASWVPLGVVV
jgi:hypothetical protein